MRRDLVNEWRRFKIFGHVTPYFPVVRWERVLHLVTGGRRAPHSLEGGWCPLCRAVFDYDSKTFQRNGKVWPVPGSHNAHR